MINFSEFWDDVVKYDLKTDLKYFHLRKYFPIANGCGAKGGFKFPGSFLFVSIISTCIIHDLEWEVAKNLQELLEANERFDNNLKRITDKASMNTVMKWIRRQMISYYISGVELKGTHDYAKERGFF